jgi:hypothetical protein
VALWLKAVTDADEPRENECHIRTRLTRLVPDPDEVHRALYDSSGLSDADRAEQFRRVRDERLTPLLAATRTLAELRTNRALLDRGLVGGEAISLVN